MSDWDELSPMKQVTKVVHLKNRLENDIDYANSVHFDQVLVSGTRYKILISTESIYSKEGGRQEWRE